MREQRGHRVVAFVGNLAGKHLVEDATERIDVGPRVGVRAGYLLGRHVVDGSDEMSLGRQAGGGVELLRKPEVGQVRVLLAVAHRDQDVRGLDISMYEAAAMCSIERGCELLEQLNGALRFDRSVLHQDLAEVRACDVVHHEEQQPLVLARVVDPHDVGVVQGRGRSHFASEALAELLIVGQCRVQHLQRVDPVERDVCHAINQAHSSAADQFVDSIAPDYFAPLQFIASNRHR